MTQRIAFPGEHLIAASSPGGMPRHFRVQLFDASTGTWHLHSAFRYIDDANACAAELSENGQQARVVKYRLCAAAA